MEKRIKEKIVKNWDYYIEQDKKGHNPSLLLNDIDKIVEENR